MKEAKMVKAHHKWSVEDDTVALYLYRFGDSDLPYSRKSIGEKLGMGAGAMRMRIANFLSLDGGEGLNHPAKQSREIYLRHRETSREELRLLVLRALA